MKITEVISDTNIGGAGVLLASLAEGLKNEFEIEVIMPRGSLLYNKMPSGIKITELQIAKDRSFSGADFPLFYRYFLKTKPDIIHTHASLTARLAGKLATGAFCLSTRHCARPIGKAAGTSPIKSKAYNFCTDLTVSTADFATHNLIFEGVDENRIITIKNGSPDMKKCVTGATISVFESLGLSPDTKIIGSVARLEKVKGQDLILRAAPEILAHFPKAHFLFIGAGSMKCEYKKLAANLGIEKNVTFLGFVDNPENYQQIFTVNVNSSRGTETSCLAISECLSLGIPTVASDFGGNTEMIKDFKNGFIFSSDNPHVLSCIIIRLLRDTALYQKLSIGARESYLKFFSRDRMIDDYKKLFHRLDSERQAKRRYARSRSSVLQNPANDR